MANTILHTTQTRVFLTSSKSSPAVAPEFQDCMVMEGITQSYGDREPIYCQDPYRIGRFKTIGFTESPPEAVETTLSARYPFDARSPLIKAARAQAPVDVHVHMGAIGADPTIFDTWTKKIIFEATRFSSLDIDELGSHEEDTVVNHSVDVTAENWYEVVQPAFSERAVGVSTGAITGVGLFYTGRLDLPPRERVLAFAVTAAAGGSPGTPPDLLFSLDQGTAWRAIDVDTIATAEPATGVVVIGDYVVVIGGTTTTYGLHYTQWSALNPTTVPTWTRVSTGFTATKTPNYITAIGSVGFIAANGGYVYKVRDAASGVTAMTSGTITTQNLNAIDASDENTIVAVGQNNVVLVCTDGDNFAAVTGPAAGVHMTAVAVFNATTFLVGTSAGRMYYTTNAGLTWTEKSFQGAGASGGRVNDIRFASTLIGYMVFEATGVSSLFATTNAGYSWTLIPSGGLLALSSGYDRVGVLREDPNIVIAGGPNENNTTGSIVMGEPVD